MRCQVALDAFDTGAIHWAAYSPASWGFIIRHNLIAYVGYKANPCSASTSCMLTGIYADDGSFGFTAHGNVKAPLHRCTAAPLHRCTAAPLHLGTVICRSSISLTFGVRGRDLTPTSGTARTSSPSASLSMVAYATPDPYPNPNPQP